MKKVFLAAITAGVAFVSALLVLNSANVANIALLLVSVTCLSAIIPRVILNKDNIIGGYMLEMVIGIGWFSSILVVKGVTIYALINKQAAVDFDAAMMMSAATLMLVGISGFFWQAITAQTESEKAVSTPTKLEKLTMQKNKCA